MRYRCHVPFRRAHARLQERQVFDRARRTRSIRRAVSLSQSRRSSSRPVVRPAEPAPEHEMLRRRDRRDRIELQEAEPPHGARARPSPSRRAAARAPRCGAPPRPRPHARSTPSSPRMRASLARRALELRVDVAAHARLGCEAADAQHALRAVGLQVGAAEEAVACEERQHVVAVNALVLALVDLDHVLEAEEPLEQRPVPDQVVERADEHRRRGRAVELRRPAGRRTARRRRRPRPPAAGPPRRARRGGGCRRALPPFRRQCSRIAASVSAPRASTASSANVAQRLVLATASARRARASGITRSARS